MPIKALKNMKEQRVRIRAIRDAIREFTEKLRPIQTLRGELQLELSYMSSDTGRLLLDLESSPGERLRIYERWLKSTQGVEGPIRDTRVEFSDNTSKTALNLGSATTTKGKVKAGIWAPGSSSYKEISNTVNDVSLASAGSAHLKLAGGGVIGVFTFQDPHAAAEAANLIIRLSESVEAFLLARDGNLLELNRRLDAVEERMNELNFGKLKILKLAEEVAPRALARHVPELAFIRSL